MTIHQKTLQWYHTQLYMHLEVATSNQDYPDELSMVFLAGHEFPRIQITDTLCLDSTDASGQTPESLLTPQQFYRQMSQAVMGVDPETTAGAYQVRTLAECLMHKGALPIGLCVAPQSMEVVLLWGEGDLWLRCRLLTNTE